MDVKKIREQNSPPKKLHRTVRGTSGAEKVKARKYWIGGYIFIALLSLAAYFLLQLKAFEIFGSRLQLFKKISISIFFAFLVLTTGKIIEMLVMKRSQSKALRYNLVRVIRLLTVLFIIVVFVSFL